MTQRRAALLVAANGGHLEQLTQLEARLRPRFDHVVYATSFGHQSRSLLAHRDVRFVREVPPRGSAAAAKSFVSAVRMLRRERMTDVVSTGSAVAVPYLAAARSLGLNAHYIESAARTTGPSLTGRILKRIPGVNLYSQYEAWADDHWQYQGSVLDGYRPTGHQDAPATASRVVVTLGTMSRYPFDRAVAAILGVLPHVSSPDARIFWQVGDAATEGLPGEAHPLVPAHTLRQEIEKADLVFAHAGTGSCLQILSAGRVPVLLPRSVDHGEHVDDHQEMIASTLAERGLAVSCSPDDLSTEHARSAMGTRVVRDSTSTIFDLADEPRRVGALGTVPSLPFSLRTATGARWP